MNTYDSAAERFYVSARRIVESYLDKPWVHGESRRLLEEEIYNAARNAAWVEGLTMDCACAMAAYCLWVMVLDHPTYGPLPFRDML